MEIVYTRHEGFQPTKPLEIDTESSKSLVYLRKNIEEVVKKDTEGNQYSCWEYDEAALTTEEFDKYKSEAALMTLRESSSIKDSVDSSSENLFTVMEAIADTYIHLQEEADNQMVIMEAIADLYTIIGEGV